MFTTTKLKKLPSKGGGNSSISGTPGVVATTGSPRTKWQCLGIAGSIFFIGFCVYTRIFGGLNNKSNDRSYHQVGEHIGGGNSDVVKVKMDDGPPQTADAAARYHHVANDDDDDVDENDAVTAVDDNKTPEVVVPVSPKDDELAAPVVQELSQRTPPAHLRTSTSSSTTTAQPTTISALFQALDKAREAFLEKLKIDYGEEQYENMFFTTATSESGQRVTRGRTIMSSPSGGLDRGGVSFDRLRRKMVQKILQAQSSSATPGTTTVLLPFVWATGGHSTAAAHGNLYNESYTAVMERNAFDLFQAVGLQLEGRNFGMGTTASGMEIASCIKEVFGQDVDILSWDFGMSDVNHENRMELYMYHAFASGNRPVSIGLDGASRHKNDVMQHLEERGIPVLFKDHIEARDIEGYIPDTLGKSQAEIDAMPLFVQSFKCGNSQLELGEPTCTTSKFIDTHDEDCEKRRYRVSWHPGWKSHALLGNLIALFLMEVLYDALRIIQARQEESNDHNISSTARQMLEELQKQEDAEYNLYQQSDLPPLSERNVQWPNELQKKKVLSIIYKHPSFCHTARVPTVIRHEGILTMSQQKGVFDYDKGIELNEAREMVSYPVDNTIPLVYDQSVRQKCQYNIQIDYRDFFYLHGKQHGDSMLLLPNAEEQRVYRKAGEATKGIVAICFSGCDQGGCPKEAIRGQGLREGKVLFHINNVPVTNVTLFGETEDCYLLTNEEHGPYWKANDNDQYEIRGRVQDPELDMRISSLIIW